MSLNNLLKNWHKSSKNFVKILNKIELIKKNLKNIWTFSKT